MHQIKQSFSLAIKSLLGSKMRAFLTMLGIIIGIAAVIILVGIVGGFSKYMTDAFSGFGANQLTVSVSSNGTKSVTEADMEKYISSNLDLYASYSPTVMGSATIKNGTNNMTSSYTGVSEYYVDVDSLTLSEGRFIQYSDCLSRQKVVIIGTYQVDELFEGESPIGKTMKIGNNVFTVVGVIEETEERESGSADDCVYIPYTTALRMGRSSKVTSYTINCADSEVASEAKTALEEYLFSILLDEDSYSVFTFTSILDAMNSMLGILQTILVGIASISLLVSGIGIMNIMIVTVTERTREIGIRKAVGAKRRNILSQFVIEAAVTAGIGGIIGIIVGVLLANPIASIMGISADVSTQWIIIAFCISAAIGIVFGYFPARKASRMNPIDALRYD